MEKQINFNEMAEIFHFEVECGVCGNDEDIEFYIDDENSTIYIYCPKCETREPIEF
jgi:sarcosine oxidase delta subunit